MALAGIMDAKEANERCLAVDGAKGFSTFYGYYMLRAMALAGNYQGALDVIRTYWGAMLDVGATTFWEDFNMEWLPDAGRIDELVPAGKKDIHGDYGAYCYQGFPIACTPNTYSLNHDVGPEAHPWHKLWRKP
jgi:hypothetical protein